MNKPITPHIHTLTCWQDTHSPECYEYCILELSNAILKMQAGLRAVGGSIDKLESIANKATLPSIEKGV
jgi:hypothetical protein